MCVAGNLKTNRFVSFGPFLDYMSILVKMDDFMEVSIEMFIRKSPEYWKIKSLPQPWLLNLHNGKKHLFSHWLVWEQPMDPCATTNCLDSSC